MAHPQRRRNENIQGPFYVDSTCIDCDACRAHASGIFSREADQSAVSRQPEKPTEFQTCFEALSLCPTASIGFDESWGPPPSLTGMVPGREVFPQPLDGPVSYCGFHSEKSFGAASYFIKTPHGGVLLDSPRWNAGFAKKLAHLGGVTELLLTHGDDVADHAAYANRFNCRRTLHAGDQRAAPEVENILQGDSPLEIFPDMLAIPVPGHTRGSCCFLYQQRYLFTGDHLAWSERRGHLYAFKDACWFSWKTQISSMERLLDYSFEWVLPGHGRKIHLSTQAMRKSLEQCLTWMKK
jgi:glyoxylase-like metal-dependent hydrolase (beta-lactamase superfamily II)/ferredoxin